MNDEKRLEQCEQKLQEMQKINEKMAQHVCFISYCVAGLYVAVAVGTFCGVYKSLSK